MEDEVPEVSKNDQDSQELDLNEAIKQCLKKALCRGSVSRGVNEVCRSLDQGQAQVCFLSSSCDHDKYKQIIKALCHENNVPLIPVADGTLLGQWVGLCKYDDKRKPRKAVRTSCVTINNYGEESEAKNFLQNHLGSL